MANIINYTIFFVLIGLASSRLIVPESLIATDQFDSIKQILQEKLAQPEIQAALSLYGEKSHLLEALKSPVPQIQQCDAKEFLSALFQSRGSSLEQFETRLAYSLNASDFVNVTNSELGVELLVINGDVIQLKTAGVQKLIITLAKQQIKSNVKSKLVQLALNTAVKIQVNALTNELDQYLSRIQISVDEINDILTEVGLRQRGFISNILDKLLDSVLNAFIQQIRVEIYKIIYPYYKLVIQTFNDVIETLMLFYTTSQPNGVLAQTVSASLNLVVVKAVTIVGGIEYNITVIFDKIFGNITINDERKRRSIEETTSLEVIEEEDNQNSPLDVILKPINLVLKTIVSQSLTELYPVVGEIVLKPVKGLLYDVIDSIIRCSSC